MTGLVLPFPIANWSRDGTTSQRYSARTRCHRWVTGYSSPSKVMTTSSTTTWSTYGVTMGTVEVHVGTCNEESASTGREEEVQ